MRRRMVLTRTAAALSAVALAGCSDAANESGTQNTTTLQSTRTTTTTTTTTSTTREPCSTDWAIENPPEKPDDLASGAADAVTRVERAVASQHFDPDGYFNFSLTPEETTEAGDAVEVAASVEVDFESSGDGEDATTVHAHLTYETRYRLTARRVERVAAEEGSTGTAVCW